MKILNRALLRLGYVLTPTPPSAKALREHANVSECHHPAATGRTVEWMRALATTMDGGR